MTVYSSQLNQDSDGNLTSSTRGDRGDGTTDWFLPVRILDTSALGLLKLEDAVHASGDAGVQILAVRKDVAAALAGTDGDYSPLSVDALGRLRITGAHLEDAAHTSGDAGVMALGVRNDALANLSGTDGDYTPLGVDAHGAQFVHIIPPDLAGHSPSNATSTAYEASRVVKASAGTLLRISGYNSGAAQFIQVHDKSSLPADGQVPVIILRVANNTNFDVDLGVYGRRNAVGITVCNSSTGPTKTIGAADCWFDILYQ